jgi:hypothetical protein
MESYKNEVIIQGLDLEEVIGFINRKNKRYLAICLQDLEDIIKPDSNEYALIRKLLLDNFNDYTRAVLKIIFGDIEYLSNYTHGRSK